MPTPIVTTREFKSCALYFVYKRRNAYTRNVFVAYMYRVSEKYREKMTTFYKPVHTLKREALLCAYRCFFGTYRLYMRHISESRLKNDARL